MSSDRTKADGGPSAEEGSTDQGSVEHRSTDQRLGFALRQGALMTATLLLAGTLTSRLRPEQASDRGFLTTPFLWAIVIWLAVLVFHAIAFERSEIHRIERTPMAGGAMIGLAVFVVGLVALEGGSLGDRVPYLFASAVGTAIFWWGLFGLLTLVVVRLGDGPASDVASGVPSEH